MLPPDPDVDADQLLDVLDGLILAGGRDIDPATYGAERANGTDDPRTERDEFELALAQRAMERDIPLLGICRGMQLMNIARGGTLVQTLPEHLAHRRSMGTFDGNDHPVRLEESSLAARATGEVSHGTLSHHHQGIDRVGDGLARHRLGRRGRAAGGAGGPGAAVRARRPVASRGGSRVARDCGARRGSTAKVTDVAVIGGGVVGTAVTLALARRGVNTVLYEARDRLAGAASGSNSGILHTGFDSIPGELETQLILRSAELRDEVVETLGIPVWRCGARLDDRVIEGESITDPVHYTRALATAAQALGAEIRTGVRVTERLDTLTVNCAGLYADEVARLYGDDSFEIYPRKGEFFVFDGIALDRILLPPPTRRTKGVLVFPTLDGAVVAGPTAVDQTDKEDWSVRPEALAEVRAKAADLLPAIARAEPIASWAGLRPAGRGVNYVIAPRACRRPRQRRRDPLDRADRVARDRRARRRDDRARRP